MYLLIDYLRNSWIIGSRISAGKSSHFAGKARNLFTLVFEALFKFGQPGNGHAVYRPLTALHLQVLHTRAPGAIWSSRRPYWDAWLRGNALLCVFPSTIFWQTVQAWGPICLPPSGKRKKKIFHCKLLHFIYRDFLKYNEILKIKKIFKYRILIEY